MTNILIYLSDYSIPIIMFYIVITGLFNKKMVYEDFGTGAKEGMKIVVQLVPTLIGLMVAIGVMRSSGIFELLVSAIKPVTNLLHFPSELLPLVVIKMFSSSAATSLLIDIFKEYGTDSYNGILSSIMMSSSETIFYTLAVYTTAGGIKKTRYIIPGGIIATISGIVCSVWLLNN